MSAVGTGMDAGMHPDLDLEQPGAGGRARRSPRPGRIVGATLGNDVNLRDVEGRSALLLAKAKDNNASCAIGPFLRFFDDGFTLDDVRNADGRRSTVEGEDGFRLEGRVLDGEDQPRSGGSRRRRRSGRTINIPTASCCSSARCSRRSRTATRRARASPTRLATSSPSRRRNSGASSTACDQPTNASPGRSGSAPLMRNLAARGLTQSENTRT